MTIKEMAAQDETIKEYLARTGLVPTENLSLLGELTPYNVLEASVCIKEKLNGKFYRI